MKSLNFTRNVFSIFVLAFTFLFVWSVEGQVTISSQDFENTPSTPTLTYTNTNGSNSTGTNGSGVPANSNLFVSGLRGWQSINTTSTLIFANQTLSGYTNAFIDFRLAGMSVSGTNGIDATDMVTVSISVDGGATYSSELTIAGSTSNQRWDFSATGTSTITYDGNNTPTAITSSSGIGGISTVTINIPNVNSQVRLRIAMLNNDVNERWVIDDVRVRGTIANATPTLSSPTVSSITESSAILGASISSDGGSSITARGTIYSTSSPVTLSNNPLVEGGQSTGIFTHSRTGLLAQTQYFYAGYATNSNGTALSSQGSFITLSNPPTSQASGLAATVNSASQIDLNIANAAGFPNSGATKGGYLLIYSTGTPTLASVNGQAPVASSGTIFSTTAAELSSATPSTSINVTGLSSSTTYNFIVIPYTWDGTNVTTYNYLLTSAATVSATTYAGLPSLISPTSTSITSTSVTLGANITSNGGSNLTARGTVFSISSPVSFSNNALTEGGTSTGVFTQSRTGLNPQTLYYFAGFATSNAGTALSTESSFRTFSEAPTTQVSNLNASASSPSEIALSMTGATFPNSGATNAGYVIIYSTSMPTFTANNGQVPLAGVGTIFSTSSTALPLNPATTFNIGGLLSATTYNFLVIPYTWDGSNTATYNYLTSGAQTVTQATPAATYTWTGSNNGSWTNAANWSPNRNTPSSTDIIVFNSGNTLTITGIITQSIASLSITGSATKITLTAAASSTLTIGNINGFDLNVAPGCELNLSGSSPISLVTGIGATGSISGNMKFTNAAHSLVPAESNAVTFNNGSNFIAGDLTSPGFSGNPFGSNSGVVYNGVIFSNGATFVQYEGSNPFAITQPNSRVQFQAGSNFIFSLANTGSPSLSGRTYGNLEINTTSNGLTSQTGSSALVINGNLTLTASSAAVNFNLTGGVSIAGNINVTNGQSLGFSPSAAGTLTLNGSNQQTIGGAGSITFGSNTTIQINNPAEVKLNKDIIVAGNLIINNLGVLNVSNNTEFTVTGNLTNNGTLTLESGATLLQGASSTLAGSGTYNVKQTITGGNNGSSPNGRFWYLGSPVSGGLSSILDAAGANIVKYWDEQSASWIEITDNTSALTVGRGHYLRSNTPGNHDLTFTGGSLNNGAYTFNLTANGSSFNGFNLVSNPYASYLKWDDVTKTNVGSTIWYRTSNGANHMVFDTYNSNGNVGTSNNGNGSVSQFIPPMQAFWVKVEGSTTGSIAMDNLDRSHHISGMQGMHSMDSKLMFANLSLEKDSLRDQAIVYCSYETTDAQDAFDSEKMIQAGSPQLYSKIGDKKMVINAKNFMQRNEATPLYMNINNAGTHTIKLCEFNSTFGSIWLEDKTTQQFQNLLINDTYTFESQAGQDIARFVLHFGYPNQIYGSTEATDQPNNNPDEVINWADVSVGSSGSKVIELTANINETEAFQTKTMAIFDMTGRQVLTQSFESGNTQVYIPNANGVYLVQVQIGNTQKVFKVLIQE